MRKLRSLSGKDLLRIFSSFGFNPISQQGSHVKLRRTQSGGRQTLTIPLHDEIDKGTLRAIYSQATRYIPEVELTKHFHSE